MQTVIRSFDSYTQAEAAVSALEKVGLPSADISIIAREHVRPERGTAGHEPVESAYVASAVEAAEAADGRLAAERSAAESETATGAGIGGVVGGGAGLLAGLGVLAIPGLGPVVAAGWLATTAVGAAAGVAAGGIVGALVGAGAESEDAELYSESVRRGGALVSVRVSEPDAPRIERILDSYGPIDPVARRAEYRSSGWTRFEADEPPPPPDENHVDRKYRHFRDEGMGKQV